MADVMSFDICLIKLKNSLRKTWLTADSLATSFKWGYCRRQAVHETRRPSRGLILIFWLIMQRDRIELRLWSHLRCKIFNLEGSCLISRSAKQTSKACQPTVLEYDSWLRWPAWRELEIQRHSWTVNRQVEVFLYWGSDGPWPSCGCDLWE